MPDKIKITISLANKDDAPDFLKLESLCFKMTPDSNDMYYWVPVLTYLWSYKAIVGKRIVGGIISMPTRNNSWYINSLFVHPKYRKLGIASALLKKVIRVAGKRDIILDAKTDRDFLLQFYRKYGFESKKLMKNYYRDGTDRYMLTKRYE